MPDTARCCGYTAERGRDPALCPLLEQKFHRTRMLGFAEPIAGVQYIPAEWRNERWEFSAWLGDGYINT